MRWQIAVACAAALFTSHAQAALIERDWLTPGDGLLTLDTASGVEWLNAEQTLLAGFSGALIEDRYQTVVAETQPGGRFEGFRPATTAEARSLIDSAGFVKIVPDFAVNGQAARDLQALIGSTQSPTVSLTWTDLLLGETVDAGFGQRRSVLTVFLTTTDDRLAGSARVIEEGIRASDSYPSPNNEFGVALVREIPEPSTGLLLFAGCGTLHRVQLRLNVITSVNDR